MADETSGTAVRPFDLLWQYLAEFSPETSARVRNPRFFLDHAATFHGQMPGRCIEIPEGGASTRTMAGETVLVPVGTRLILLGTHRPDRGDVWHRVPRERSGGPTAGGGSCSTALRLAS